MPISKATVEDISSLLKVINAAYRGEASTKGWTTEAHLLVGELRIDEASLLELFNNKNAVVLKFINNNEEILGNVYLEKQNDKLYLGLFSVSPDAQSQGIGKQLLKAANDYAIEQNCSSIYMTVISARHELIAWYVRHGYNRTGESKPFPVDEKFGKPTQRLELIVLQKILANKE
jgi:ribosomal protein S18 acetylase RimI-like enzyme